MDLQNPVVKEAFERLPAVLRDAISSSDVQASLRKLADTYKLHLDKWDILENEIMMALLGITDPNRLMANIMQEVGLPKEQALAITKDVAAIVFDPIQSKLRAEVGEARSAVEEADATTLRTRHTIDLSKFTQTPVDPKAYEPQTQHAYASDDPYHEPLG